MPNNEQQNVPTEYSARKRLARATQPIIFKLWKLQISHDHPNKYHAGKEVINVYWNLQHLFSLVPGHINIRLKKRMLSIPPYRD